MRRIPLIVCMALSISAFATDTVVKGHLMDAACSARKSQKPGAVVSHGRACLRMPSCEASGYGVITEDKQFLRFDAEGNEKAVKLLADLTKANDIQVTVSGNLQGDKIAVSKIELQ